MTSIVNAPSSILSSINFAANLVKCDILADAIPGAIRLRENFAYASRRATALRDKADPDRRG